MSDLKKFAQHIGKAQQEIVLAFCALGRAIRPAMFAMQSLSEPVANRKLRRAMRSGKKAKWEWYRSKRVERLVARSNPISGNQIPET